ncbi:MAG: ABC transporter ATP-binding protein [Bdellovibrionota bacterium]|nr:ABC transporter ATP-binding protein [Bdellovibrionota bacterium]
MKKILECRQLTKRFGELCAVKDLSFFLGEEEMVAILGPSGCGKSTLLRIVAGFEESDEGEIILAGKPAFNKLAPEKRNIGMVFQDLALFPHLNVFENIAFGLHSKKSLNKEEIKMKVREMLNLVGLPDYELKMPGTLSGGEQQRVALARALATNPKVLLLDEPFSGLDTKLRIYLRKEVKKILRKNKTSVILVTHDQEEAFSFADRILVMNQGQLIQAGKAREIYEKPNDKWLASFVGEANFFSKEEMMGLFSDDKVLFQRISSISKNNFAIRPHQILLKKSENQNNPNEGEIGDIEYLGEHILYEVLFSKMKRSLFIKGRFGDGLQCGDKVSITVLDFVELP